MGESLLKTLLYPLAIHPTYAARMRIAEWLFKVKSSYRKNPTDIIIGGNYRVAEPILEACGHQIRVLELMRGNSQSSFSCNAFLDGMSIERMLEQCPNLEFHWS